ncbi:MAG: 50S ribosomal protein L11 methyltransferase [Rikenellaceae bacterium]
MNYVELNITVESTEQGEIAMALLSDFPFESFTQNSATSLKAYIPQEALSECKDDIDMLIEQWGGGRYIMLEDENWNSVWESNYPSVEVGTELRIRAPFHPADPSFNQEVVIMPKMSFGTGHHSTTYLVCQALTSMHLDGFKLLDVGCGTGVLAIVALKYGAQSAVAIDIDNWSIEACEECVEMNGVADRVEIIHGDITAAEQHIECYDMVIANINRNIILSQISQYALTLKRGGDMLLSGFFTEDVDAIIAAAEPLSLSRVSVESRQGWAMLHLRKA